MGKARRTNNHVNTNCGKIWHQDSCKKIDASQQFADRKNLS